MEYNKTQVLHDVTMNYLKTLNKANLPAPAEIAENIIEQVNDTFSLRNASLSYKDRKWNMPDSLSPIQVAVIIEYLYPVKCVCCIDDATDAAYDLVAIYQDDGPEKGIYSTQERVFNQIARSFNPELSTRQLNEIYVHVRENAPRVNRCRERNLVPVNNGIFDYDTKQLMPFSSDKVFLTKCRVDYVPGAVSPVIRNDEDGTDFELEQWMNELSDDEGVTELIWEIIGACIRPNVSWDKAAWLCSDIGSNGKGSLCRLIRNICGAPNCTAIALDDFSKEFALEPLIRVSAIINDENDSDIYIDRCANLKAVITNDVIQINRKFKTPVAYQFRGFMVQCINGMPKVRDKTDSFYRRQLCIPFRKNFQGIERRYIKGNYFYRDDVLQYALYRVLNMDYYELSNPPACKAMLMEYKEFNDPLRQFWNEMEDEFVWDLLPFGFLYDLYKAWSNKNMPQVKILSSTTFTTQLSGIIFKESDEWQAPLKDKDGRYVQIRPANMMDKGEPLIGAYDLKEWMDPSYNGMDQDKKLRPRLRAKYRGIIRKTVAKAAPQPSGSIITTKGNDEKDGHTETD